MNEEIIKMARKAGGTQPKPRMQPYFWRMHEGDLERFFHMAQAAMVEQGWRKCAEGQRTTQFCGMTEKAVQEEREACAKVADEFRSEEHTSEFSHRT